MPPNLSHVRSIIPAVCTLLLLSSALALTPQKKSGDDDQQTLLRLEDRWLASEDDADSVKHILAEDFIHVLPVGFVTKNEQLNYMRKIQKTGQHIVKHFEEMRVRIYGNVGIVNGIVVEEVTEGQKRRTIFTDVFVHRDGQWQAVNAQELPFVSENARRNP